jgi:hypothetical protein
VKTYLGRDLSDPGDILSAFAGIAEGLTPYFGKFYHGIPIDHLWQLLPWHARGNPTRRQGFPSWSWAGWHWGSRAYFQFYENTLHGDCLLQMFIPSRFELDSPMAISRELGLGEYTHDHFKPDTDNIRQVINVLKQEKVDTSQLIAFFTSSAMLIIDGMAVHGEEGRPLHEIKDPSTKKTIGSMFLDKSLVSRIPSLQEFIVVSSCCRHGRGGRIIYREDYDGNGPSFRLMLIEMEGKIAHRVDTTSTVRVSDWWQLNSQRKLILLG